MRRVVGIGIGIAIAIGRRLFVLAVEVEKPISDSDPDSDTEVFWMRPFGCFSAGILEGFKFRVQLFPLFHKLIELPLQLVVFFHGGAEKLMVAVKLLGSQKLG